MPTCPQPFWSANHTTSPDALRATSTNHNVAPLDRVTENWHSSFPCRRRLKMLIASIISINPFWRTTMFCTNIKNVWNSYSLSTTPPLIIHIPVRNSPEAESETITRPTIFVLQRKWIRVKREEKSATIYFMSKLNNNVHANITFDQRYSEWFAYECDTGFCASLIRKIILPNPACSQIQSINPSDPILLW